MLSIQDFELENQIGQGGFGKVFKASIRQKSFSSKQNKVALKIIDKNILNNEELRARVAAEVSIHSQLDHPSIVSISDFFEDENCVYLIMELCDNGDLYTYLKKRKAIENNTFRKNNSKIYAELAVLSEEEIRSLMLQLGRGIGYLHENSVLHRDLKLRNLVINDEMEVKITDFGLATIVGIKGSDPTTFCGTPNYISPEVSARKPYGFATDLWALGCLILTFMRGTLPTETELINIEYNLPFTEKSYSHEMLDLTRRLLIRDPEKRITIKEYFKHPFFNPMNPQKTLPRLSTYESMLSSFSVPLQNDSERQYFENTTNKAPKKTENLNWGYSLDESSKHSNQKKSGGRINPVFSSAITDLLASRNIENTNISNDYGVSTKTKQMQNVLNEPRNTITSDIVLNTARLKPIKQKTKNATIEILTDGKVKADFTGDTHSMVFDPALNRLFLYPSGSTLIVVKNAIQEYPLIFEEMDQDLIRKVKYVHKFVELVRSKTSKIVLRTPQAKATYMENTILPDLYITFYNGIKAFYSRLKLVVEVKIPSNSDLPDEIQRFPVKKSKNTATEVYQPCFESVPNRLNSIVHHIQKCMDICIKADQMVSLWDSGNDPRSGDYNGYVKYPVNIRFDTNLETLVPDGMSKKILPRSRIHNPMQLNKKISLENTSFSHSNRETDRISRTNHTSLASITNTSSTLNQKRDTMDFSNTQNGYRLQPPSKFTHQQLTSNGSVIGSYNTLENSKGYGPFGKTNSFDLQKFVFIPSIGWCVCIKLDELKIPDHYQFMIMFVDGSRLLVDSSADNVTYWDNTNQSQLSQSSQRFYIDYSMPDHIKEKLKCLPEFLPSLGLAD
ncbi:hypothetical protein BB558_001217 [Smittium angustum]|uniref:Uncharacterized protein n=1 Tax=Smittium angustum TaxID=133377 RepID=A0A2U1JC32_SMIAN|nr:hypothetical protein BB558_005649 [Smittium angustum]PWA02657.1 hypothetical protein BB558_001217 [Smittium angustum]